jgi:hypothetical protein
MTRRGLVVLSSSAVLALVAALVLAPRQRDVDVEKRSSSAARGEMRSNAPLASVETAVAAARPAPPKLEGRRLASGRARADEIEIMTELRALAQSAPERSLELAREGDARFPGSEEAPERAWFKIRALVNLARFEEARDEAVVMVDTYRDTPWAGDVERHLLTHPLNHPTERGNTAN